MWGTNNFLWTRSNPALPFWSGPVLSGPKNIKQNSEETLHCSFCRTVEVMESKKKRKEEENSGAADRAVAEWHWAADGGCSSFLHHFSLFRLPLVFCFCACCSSSFCFIFSFAFLSISSCFSFGSSFLFQFVHFSLSVFVLFPFFSSFFFAPLLLPLLSSVSPTILSFFLSLLFFSQPSLCFFFLFSVLFSLLFLYFAPVVSLFSLCFHPLAHLSPVVFIRSKKGREGYYPCTEGASFAAALEAATQWPPATPTPVQSRHK